MKVALFARVSTIAQDYERQINELTALANRNGWTIVGTFAEKISGAKRNTERTELMKWWSLLRLTKLIKC